MSPNAELVRRSRLIHQRYRALERCPTSRGARESLPPRRRLRHPWSRFYPKVERVQMVGKILGERYRIHRLLGQGGMGTVYEAEDTTTGQRVAVKVIHKDWRLSSTLIGRFHRE